jgi:hypothetical protein
VALVLTLVEVLAVLAGMAFFLWFSAFMEARQLGPVVLPVEEARANTDLRRA